YIHYHHTIGNRTRTMRFFPPLLSVLGLASAQLFSSSKSDSAEPAKDLNLTATADFASALTPLGLKIVNREPTKVKLELRNDEPRPVTLQFVGGSFWDAAAGMSIKNLTSVKFGNIVESGGEVCMVSIFPGMTTP